MILRSAGKEEAESCYRCIEDARAYHKELGFEQWHADYPTLQTIEEDIAAGSGYVFEAEGRVSRWRNRVSGRATGDGRYLLPCAAAAGEMNWKKKLSKGRG